MDCCNEQSFFTKDYTGNFESEVSAAYLHYPRAEAENVSARTAANKRKAAQSALFCCCLAVIARNIAAQRKRKEADDK